MKIRPIKQPDAAACGPAVIKMVANYFDVVISMRRIKDIARYNKQEGMSNKDIAKTLNSIGLKVIEKNNSNWLDLKRLNNRKNAMVVSWMFKGYIGHVSVVEKVLNKEIYLADSIDGLIIRMPKIVFLRLWLDYDDKWYPKKNSDIKLRWMAIVSR